MNNEELKKKIAQIIADYFCPQKNEHKNLWGDDRLCYSKTNFAECERVTECTDALIAAGIGDVRKVEFDNDVLKQTNMFLEAGYESSEEDRQHWINKWKEAEHRAEVAEKALDKAVKLAYEIRTSIDTLSCSSCPMFDYGIFDECKEKGLYFNCEQRWKDKLLKQAEKELEEERKDV